MLFISPGAQTPSSMYFRQCYKMRHALEDPPARPPLSPPPSPVPLCLRQFHRRYPSSHLQPLPPPPAPPPPPLLPPLLRRPRRPPLQLYGWASLRKLDAFGRQFFFFPSRMSLSLSLASHLVLAVPTPRSSAALRGTTDDVPRIPPVWALNVNGCPDGQQTAAVSECLAAAREAAQPSGLEVLGFKMVNDGPAAHVPPGCSYNRARKTAIFNSNPAGASSEWYQTVCGQSSGNDSATPVSPLRVAVLCAGGLRGFTAERAQRLVTHLLSRARTDLFLCNQPGDVLDTEARRVLESGAETVVEEDAWPYEHLKNALAYRTQIRAFLAPTYEPATSRGLPAVPAQYPPDDDEGDSFVPPASGRPPAIDKHPITSTAHEWALRVTQCYTASIRHNDRELRAPYDFFVRTRPDLVFDAPLPLPASWSTSAVSSRARAYAGPAHFTVAHQAWQSDNCGGSAAAPEECMVMDDQFYVVPEALASAVFSFGASRTVTYDSPDWCTEPPLRNCRQRAGPGICRYRARFSEMDLTHFVAVRHKLPVVVIAVPAFLSTQGVDANRDDQGVLDAYHPRDWDEPRACEVGTTPLWAANLTDLGQPLSPRADGVPTVPPLV